MVDDLRKLITLVSTFEADKGPKELYSLLESYLKEVYQLEKLYVYSVNDFTVRKSGAPIEKPRHMRTLWNRKDAQVFINNKANHDLIADVLSEKKDFALGQGHFYLPMGVMDGQFVFAYAPIKKNPPTEIYNYLLEFMGHSFKMMNKWQDMSKLESLVYLDDVTGLFNQRKLIIDIKSSVENYKQRKENFVVLFIDIDHFKTVNDDHGHLVGTQILADMASLLMGLMRDSDLCYRYGGDEFVMIIPDASSENGKMIGERILKTVKGHVFEIDKALLTKEQRGLHKDGPLQFNLSVSIGVAGFPDDAKTEHEILAIADNMMYQAKQSGRGQVCFAGEIFGQTLKEG